MEKICWLVSLTHLSFKMFICAGAGAFSILSNIYNETFTKIINGLKLTIFLKNSTLGI